MQKVGDHWYLSDWNDILEMTNHPVQWNFYFDGMRLHSFVNFSESSSFTREFILVFFFCLGTEFWISRIFESSVFFNSWYSSRLKNYPGFQFEKVRLILLQSFSILLDFRYRKHETSFFFLLYNWWRLIILK